MGQFRYKAVQRSGDLISGMMEAETATAAAQQLRNLGHYPVNVSEGPANSFAWTVRARKPRLRQLAAITRELATLLTAGLELDRAFGILTKLSDIVSLKEPIERVRAKVRAGAPLADALAGEAVFPSYYASMVRAGEFGGTLQTSLATLADYLERRAAVLDTITSALVYPILLLMTAALSLIVILVFVLPEFEPLFADAGAQLPLPTRIVLGLSSFVRDFWWLELLLVAGVAYGIHYILTTPALRESVDQKLLRVPVLGKLAEAIECERFCRTLGVLSSNGVALPTALLLTRDTLGNSAIARAVGDVAARLREGDGLAHRLAQTQMFPGVLIDLVQIGEEAGKLDGMLLRHADLEEQRIRHTTERLLAALAPALTIVLGLIIAGLIASMLVAILGINDLALH